MSTTAFLRVALASLLLAATWGTTAQTGQVEQPPLVLKSTFGQDLYEFYCSGCHGVDGKGRAATGLIRPPPPSLTTLARRHNGVFPHERVRLIIGHGEVAQSPAHGSKDMPAWGTIFRALDPSDTLVDVRIENLVRYIETMQEP